MTSKTKKILFIVAAVLIIAGAAVGIIYDVTPTKDAEPENIEAIADSTASDSIVVVEDTCVVEADSITADSVIAAE